MTARMLINVMDFRDLKNYIKTSSCYPDRCTKSDYENIMKDFQDSEKVSLDALCNNYLTCCPS